MLVLNEYLTNLFEFCTLFICSCFCFVAVIVVVEGGTNTPSSWQCGQCFEYAFFSYYFVSPTIRPVVQVLTLK